MAGVKARDVIILVNELILSAQSNSVTVAIDQTPLDYTVFDTDGVLRMPQDPTSNIEHAGYFMGSADNQLEATFFSHLEGKDAFVTVLFGTKDQFPAAYSIRNTFNSSMVIAAQVNQLITVTGNWPAADYAMIHGVRLFGGVKSTIGSVVIFDNTLVSALDRSIIIHVHSMVGTTTGLVFTVNTDNVVGMSTPSVLGTINLPGVGAKSLDTVDIERYVQVSLTNLGGATSVNFSVILGG